MAGALGLRVVAEGVDSAPTHDALASLDCDQAQGFRYSPSLPAPQLLSWATDYDERHTHRPLIGPPRFVAS
jgi:EAL domain-containing protein (putative c-di-GMP-specific phosphodiesterase class I)